MFEQRKKELAEKFSQLDSDSKWSFLLKLAKNHTAIAEELKQEKFLVKGCATRLFLVPQFENGKLNFAMDTDGGGESPLIVRGLAALVQDLLKDLSPKEILDFDPSFFQEIGLNVALSATRANGFASMLKQMKMYAQVFVRMQA